MYVAELMYFMSSDIYKVYWSTLSQYEGIVNSNLWLIPSIFSNLYNHRPRQYDAV